MSSLSFFFFVFLGPQPWHMKIPRLGVESELQLQAYTTDTEMQDPSCVCDLPHSSWQCQILNPLSEARDQSHVLMDTSQVHYCWATMGTPVSSFWSVWLGVYKCHSSFLRVSFLFYLVFPTAFFNFINFCCYPYSFFLLALGLFCSFFPLVSKGRNLDNWEVSYF